LIEAIEALAKLQQNLEETIASLLELRKGMPEGEIRDKLLDEISDLDTIADVMRKVLNMIVEE
jgi:hypothetical protein